LELESCSLYRTAWIEILLFYTSYHSWDERHEPRCPTFSIEMRSCELFYPGWPVTTTHQVSASQVVRITGVSHWCSAANRGNLTIESSWWVCGVLCTIFSVFSVLWDIFIMKYWGENGYLLY
jgi:hypothetical protein